MKKQETILVTGVAGFIGYNLGRALILAGYRVVGIDNFDPYYDVTIKRKRVIELEKMGLRFHEGDICHDADLKVCFSEKIDKVVHLAAKVGVRHSFGNLEGYNETNVFGTVKVLSFCVDNGVRQLIFASSSSVYGNQIKMPFNESDVGQGQLLSPYAVSKRSAELWCELFSRTYHLPISILRFFTVYGSEGRPDMVVQIIKQSLKNRKAFTVYGDGETERDYTHVDDIVEGIKLALNKLFDFEIFNLGNSKPIRLHELISLFQSASKARLTIDYKEAQNGEVIKTYADIEKAERLLGWRPAISIAEGVLRVVNVKT